MSGDDLNNLVFGEGWNLLAQPRHPDDGCGLLPVHVFDGVRDQLRLLGQVHDHGAVGPRTCGGGLGAELEVLADAVGVFIVLEDRHVHGGLAHRLGRGDPVVAGNGCLQRNLVVHHHADGGLGGGVAVVGDGVADIDRPCGTGRRQDDAAAGLAHGRLEGVVSLDAVREDPDEVAVGIGVITGGVYGDLPSRPDLDLIIDGGGVLVGLTPRGDAHRHGPGVDGALAVHHFVAERIGSGTVAGGGEVDEVAAHSGGSHGRGAVDTGQLHGVAVGIDAVQRDGNAHCSGGHHTGGEVPRLRPGVLGAFQGQDVDGDGGCALLALGVHRVVDGAHRLGLRPGDEAQGVFGDEALAVQFIHCLRQDRVNGKRLALRVGVVVQHGDGDDVVDTDVHFVRLGLGCFDDGGGRDGDHGDAAGG